MRRTWATEGSVWILQTSLMIKRETDLWEAVTEVDGWRTWALTRQTVTGGLGPVQTLTMDLPEEMMPLERDLETVMSQIVTEMGRGGTMTVMTVEEIATGIAMMTETAETTIEEVLTLVVEEVVVPLAAASAVITMTVGVAVTVMGTGIATATVTVTGMKDAMKGVRREVSEKLPSRDPS